MTREEFAKTVWYSSLSLKQLARKYGVTIDDVRAAADYACELGYKLDTKEPRVPFDEALKIMRRMADQGYPWRDIAKAIDRSIYVTHGIAQHHRIRINRGMRPNGDRDRGTS